jgi:hypothetical protein
MWPGSLVKSRSTLGFVDKLDRHFPKQTRLVPNSDRLQTLQAAGAILQSKISNLKSQIP